MRSRVLLFIGMLILCLILIGCGKSSATSTNVISLDDLWNKASIAVDLSEMKELDSDKFQKFFDIETVGLKGFKACVAQSNVKADEIAVIEAKDTKIAMKVKKQLDEHLRVRGEEFKDYLPEEYDLFINANVFVKDRFVAIVVSQKANSVRW